MPNAADLLPEGADHGIGHSSPPGCDPITPLGRGRLDPAKLLPNKFSPIQAAVMIEPDGYQRSRRIVAGLVEHRLPAAADSTAIVGREAHRVRFEDGVGHESLPVRCLVAGEKEYRARAIESATRV